MFELLVCRYTDSRWNLFQWGLSVFLLILIKPQIYFRNVLLQTIFYFWKIFCTVSFFTPKRVLYNTYRCSDIKHLHSFTFCDMFERIILFCFTQVRKSYFMNRNLLNLNWNLSNNVIAEVFIEFPSKITMFRQLSIIISSIYRAVYSMTNIFKWVLYILVYCQHENIFSFVKKVFKVKMFLCPIHFNNLLLILLILINSINSLL